MWNTRFLPFWMLMWGFIAAMGATEIVRFLADGVDVGVLVDQRRRSPRRRAPAPGPRSRSTTAPTSIREVRAARGRGARRAAVRRRAAGLGTARAPRLPSGCADAAARDRRRSRSRSWWCSAAIFGLRLGVERAQRQPRDPRRGLGAVQLRRLPEPARVARVPVADRDDGQAAAGPRAVGGRRRRSATTAPRSRSSCCRTSPRAASTRWRASTSSRRPRRRSTS